MNFRSLATPFVVFLCLMVVVSTTSCAATTPINPDALAQNPYPVPNTFPPTEIIPSTATPTSEPTSTPPPTNTIPPPSGEIIFFSGNKIINYHIDSRQFTELATISGGEILGVSLAPDLNTLAYATNDGLFYMDLATDEIINPIPNEKNTLSIPRGFNPRSLPGRTQLLVSIHKNKQFSFAILNQAPGMSRIDLPPPPASNSYGCDSGVAWSTTGDNIVVSGLNSSIPCNTNPGLTIIKNRRGLSYQLIQNKIGTGLSEKDQRIAGTRTPSWSPDGSTIYFSLDISLTTALQYSSQIFSIQENGSNLTQISVNNKGIAAYPLATNFGVLFYSVSGDNPQTDGIYQHHLSTMDHLLIVNISGSCPLAISQEGRFLLYGVNCNENFGAIELRLFEFSTGQSQIMMRSQDGKPIQYLGWKK